MLRRPPQLCVGSLELGPRGRNVLVDLVRFELTTSSMPWKRAPNCATGPIVRAFLTLTYSRPDCRTTHRTYGKQQSAIMTGTASRLERQGSCTCGPRRPRRQGAGTRLRRLSGNQMVCGVVGRGRGLRVSVVCSRGLRASVASVGCGCRYRVLVAKCWLPGRRLLVGF